MNQQKQSKTLVTCYENPDLDGSASAFAYAEFLNKTGKKATAGIFGELHPEAEFVFNKAGAKIRDAKSLNQNCNEIILTDASEPKWLIEDIETAKVIEVIDHRKVHSADSFVNAKTQIELVGSCATLIAEKFFENNIELSHTSAILLYGAIISNTISFQANVTTNRDKSAAKKLKIVAEINDSFASEMFEYKSKINEPTNKYLEKELATNEFNGNKVGIFQIEILKVDEFITKNLKDIFDTIKDTKTNKKLDCVFLTCTDIGEAENTFVANDKETQKILSDILDIKFSGNVAKRPGIIMRKEIMPKLKEYFKKWKKVSAIILENKKDEILLYLRDNKPEIPFPHHWDLFGGHIEKGETPEEALEREVEEELGININNYKFFKKYVVSKGDASPNIKYVYSGKIDKTIDELTLHEGEKLLFFKREEIPEVKFANVLKDIVMEYINQ